MRLYLASLGVVLVLLLSSHSADCVGSCFELCTKYEQAVCEAQDGACTGLTDQDLEDCLNATVPCYFNETNPESPVCWAQFSCCQTFSENNNTDELDLCLRFSEECTGNLTAEALERCVWRIQCNKSQPIPKEECPQRENLCFTRRQQSCACVNNRLFNCEITCDLSSSCCQNRTESAGSLTCDAFSGFIAKRALRDANSELEEDVEDDEFNDLVSRTEFREKLETYQEEDVESDLTKRHKSWHQVFKKHRRTRRNRRNSSRRRRRRTSTVAMTTTPAATTTMTTPDPRNDATKDPNCPSDIPTYEHALASLNYSTCQCGFPPWLPQEFVQVVVLNYTYIMDLAPVGITP